MKDQLTDINCALSADTEQLQKCGKPEKERFPQILHRMLLNVEASDLDHILSFFPHGRAFIIHNPKAFEKLVMPKYFRMSHMASFRKQLNLYGFKRIVQGPEYGGYYHELFIKGRPDMCAKIFRPRVKDSNASQSQKCSSSLLLNRLAPNHLSLRNSSCAMPDTARSSSPQSPRSSAMYPSLSNSVLSSELLIRKLKNELLASELVKSMLLRNGGYMGGLGMNGCVGGYEPNLLLGNPISNALNEQLALNRVMLLRQQLNTQNQELSPSTDNSSTSTTSTSTKSYPL